MVVHGEVSLGILNRGAFEWYFTLFGYIAVAVLFVAEGGIMIRWALQMNVLYTLQ